MGGFGPAQYLALTPQAVALGPRVLVVALYLGNDITDACSIGSRLAYWRDRYRAEGLATQNCAGASNAIPDPPGRSLQARLSSFAKSTRTGSLLHQFAYLPIRAWWDYRVLKRSPPGTILADDERVISLFPVLGNQSDAASEGYEITLRLLTRVFEKAGLAGVCPALLLLPSKQNVLLPHLAANGYPLSEAFVASVEAERKFAEGLASGARERGVPVADATSALREAWDKGDTLYPPDLDSHPTGLGYLAYARVAADLVTTDACARR